MKNLSVSTIFILSMLYADSYAQTFKSFQTRYNLGISLEFLGVSPLGSVNVELMVFKRPKTFINVQAGIGLI